MPLNVVCNSCRKAVMIEDIHAGKRMRCPYCQAVFQAPIPAGAAVGGAAQAGGGFDWTGAKVSAGEVLAVSSGNRNTSNVAAMGDPGWPMVRNGLRLVAVSVLLVFANVAYFFLAALLASGGIPRGLLLDMGTIVAQLMGFVGVLGLLAGTWLCTLVPKETNLKTLAQTAAGCITASLPGLYFAARYVYMFVKSAIEKDAAPSLPWLAFLGIGLLTAGAISFTLFLRALANFFGSRFLANSLQLYLYYAASLPAAGLVVMFFTNIVAGVAQGSGMIFLSMLAILMAGITFIWLFNLLRDVITMLNGAMRKQV